MIQIKNLFKNHGGKELIRDLSMELEKGKVSVFLGPSGCGKSTLLNILASLDEDYRGEICVGGSVGYIFQEDRLIPWLTVMENLSLISSSSEDILYTLEKFHVAEKSDVLAGSLSGGEKQRVSIARAFCHGGEVLLMDEALRSLDLPLKLKIINEICENIEGNPKTMVVISHDIQEALLIGDDIYMLKKDPMEILDKFTVKTPRGIRNLKEGELLDLEKRIYEKLLSVTEV